MDVIIVERTVTNGVCLGMRGIVIDQKEYPNQVNLFEAIWVAQKGIQHLHLITRFQLREASNKRKMRAVDFGNGSSLCLDNPPTAGDKIWTFL